MTRDDDRLAELLERWEAAAAAGNHPTPEDLCRDTPNELPAFRDLLRQLGQIGLMTAGDRNEMTPAAGFRAGRYVAESFHAAGGLGVVFRARDEELNRPVALKCLRSTAPADSPVGKRFLQEAEVTSRLEHPGIAPVHGRGETADGRPFYAMRFIEGETLQEAANRVHKSTDTPESERNVELRRLLRAFVGVCQTVAYAHSRGVIHRDLKPANVMVGPFGEVLVMDWGLAAEMRTAEVGVRNDGTHSAPHSEVRAPRSELTVEGQAKGSPAFMSPEQARGDWDHVGPASDVYSLGSTLYYLLTGRVPYSGRDILAQVRAGRYSLPREVKGPVPSALDAVCRKAMAFHPADRYESARALADDVERWLADEPVTAWREPVAVRARRWVKRHRTLVTASGAALVVGFVLLAVAGYRLDRKNDELQSSHDREVGLRRTADERFTLALDSTTHLVTDVQTKLVRSPATRAVRESILKDAITRLYQLVQSADQTRDADRTAVKARLQLGDLYRDVEQNPTKAAAEYLRALKVARTLREQHPDDAEVTLDVVAALQKLGAAEATFGHFTIAGEDYAEAARLLEPAGPAGDQARARNLYQQGRLALATGDAPRAAARLGEAKAILVPRKDPESLFALGEVVLAIGEAAYRGGRFADAARELPAAVGAWLVLSQQRPGDVTVKRKLALTHDWLANAHRELGQWDVANSHVRLAFDLTASLADQDPDNLEDVRELAVAHCDLALSMALAKDVSGAESHFADSMKLVERLSRADPNDLTARRTFAVALDKLAQVAQARRQYPLAVDRWRDAIGIARDILSKAPDQVLVRAELAEWLKDLGRLYLRYLPEKAAGLTTLAESRAEWETLTRTDPTNLAWTTQAIEVYRLLGTGERTTRRDLDRADEAFAAGLAFADRLPAVMRERPTIRRETGRLRVDARGLLVDRLKSREAADVTEREIDALKKAAPDVVTLEQLERNHAFLANLYRKIDPAKSIEHTKEAVAAARRGLAMNADSPEFRQALQIHLGWLAERQINDDPAAALALFREAIDHFPHLPPDLAETSFLRTRRAALESRAGDCCEMLDRPKEAVELYTRALDLHTNVVDLEPTQPATRAAVAYDHRRLGELRMWLLNFPASVAEYEKAKAVLDQMNSDKVPLGFLGQQSAKLIADYLPLVKSLPAAIETLDAVPKKPTDLRLDALRLRVAWLLGKDRVPEAADVAEAMAKEKAPNGDALARAAIEFARLAGKSGEDQYADRAIELLKQAKGAGYFRDPGAVPWLTWEPLFEPLRKKQAFAELAK